MTEKTVRIMTEEERGLEALKKLNLVDDFLFDVVTGDLEACRVIIELSLGIKIKSIRWKDGQKVIHNLPGKRGIRLDFYVKDEKNQIFDVEMQKRNEGNIPKRTRFYQALMDAPLLESGEKGFDKLNSTYIVIICGFDLYHKGKYRYTFENICKEVPGLSMGDGSKKIFLNTKGKNDNEVEKSLIEFLRYVEKSDESSISEDCDERVKYLNHLVSGIKCDKQLGVVYMKMEERDRLIAVKGEMRGGLKKLIEQVCKKLAKSKTADMIAEELEEEIGLIRQICEISAKENTYDCDLIYEKLEQEMTSHEEN